MPNTSIPATGGFCKKRTWPERRQNLSPPTRNIFFLLEPCHVPCPSLSLDSRRLLSYHPSQLLRKQRDLRHQGPGRQEELLREGGVHHASGDPWRGVWRGRIDLPKTEDSWFVARNCPLRRKVGGGIQSCLLRTWLFWHRTGRRWEKRVMGDGGCEYLKQKNVI